MDVVYLLLLVGAVVCFALAAFRGEGYAHGRRTVSLVALGLLLWVLVPTLQHLDSML